MNEGKVNTLTCDFEMLALEDQMSRERFEQIKQERPDFALWLNERRQGCVQQVGGMF